MYIAALRIADDFGCHTIGIQYQQGLKDLLPASDLVEGTLNNADRPPVNSRDGSRVLYEGEPLPHFNEVDECAGPRWPDDLSRAQGDGPAGGKHAARFALGRSRPIAAPTDDYVWVFLDQRLGAAGAFRRRLGRRHQRAAAAHVLSGSAAARSKAFPSRAKSSGRESSSKTAGLNMDLGRAGVVELPREETERRWKPTTPQWPIMHAVTYGVIARPDDGPAQSQPHPSRLRQQRRRSRPGSCSPKRPWPRRWELKRLCAARGKREHLGRRLLDVDLLVTLGE